MSLACRLPSRSDVVIVGAGAAGLSTAIFLRRLAPSCDVLLLDGARMPGAKILVSGGSRCNVTNDTVSERDFWGGPRSIIRRVLRALPVQATVEFFNGIGVSLHEEAGGKLFPDSNRSRDVLEALLGEAEARLTPVCAGTRVERVRKDAAGFAVVAAHGEVRATCVVLATGGQSLPKTGSDGKGFEIAASLGHTIVPTTPGLVPLTLADEGLTMHRRLTGVAHPAELRLWLRNRLSTRIQGSLLWTHFGISGPAALDMSRHYLRARLEDTPCRLTLSFVPNQTFDATDAHLTRTASERPRLSVQSVLASLLPDAVASLLLAELGISARLAMATLPREDRRRLVHALCDWPLHVIDSRGYNYAEVTAGGVPLTEIDAGNMESLICPGLYLVGEILDVDGRIGGFNFQWAWASAFVAARAIGRRHLQDNH